VEFVKDKATKAQFDERINFGIRVGKNALQKGLIIRFDPNWCAFAPPLIIENEEVDQMMQIFHESLKETLAAT
jgi:adenosylmethionine-8-amino-7-oxononanoate aminotransferase